MLSILLDVLKEFRAPIQRTVGETARKLSNKPGKDERSLIIRFVRRLDERRVFFAPYDQEVVECCLASLGSLKKQTEEALLELEHAAARAAVGGILDAIRSFLDKWYGFVTPRAAWDFHRRPPPPMPPSGLPRWHRDDDSELAMFFKDLGELRLAVRLMVALLQEIEPKVEAPNLLEQPDAAALP